MNRPDDFGLMPAATLAHTANAVRPPGFGQQWDRWTRAVSECDPTARPLEGDLEGSAGARGVTHVIRSIGGVRLGCRVTLPRTGRPPAIVVTSHGYHVAPGEPLTDDAPWCDRGLGVVRLRVRGYPGSQFDTGDLTATPGGYITRGLGEGEEWVINGAVADVAMGVRAARALVGAGVPIMLHGESFGGGLAVIAASMLPRFEPIERLALGVPTFGDWAWRLSHRTEAGAGAEIRRYIEANPNRGEAVREVLGQFDAVVHAARVVCPTVCKLAHRDEVVPAPTAAAIFNSLGADPGRKWRFVVETAHTDHVGGADMADLRRHALFEDLIGAFLDPRERLETLMASWEDRLRPGRAGE